MQVCKASVYIFIFLLSLPSLKHRLLEDRNCILQSYQVKTPNFNLLDTDYMLGSVLATWNKMVNKIRSLGWKSICLFYGRREDGIKWEQQTSIQVTITLQSYVTKACGKYRKCHGNRDGKVTDPDLGDSNDFLKMALELVPEAWVGFFFSGKIGKRGHSKEREEAGESIKCVEVLCMFWRDCDIWCC